MASAKPLGRRRSLGAVRAKEENSARRGGKLYPDGGAGGFQGAGGAGGLEGLLRHHPKRAGRADGAGLPGAAPHLRRTGALPPGLPAVRQRADGGAAAEPGGDKADQRGAAPEDAGAGQGDRPGGTHGVPAHQLPRIRPHRGGAAAHHQAVRLDPGGLRVLYRRGDDRFQRGEKQALPPPRGAV